MALSLCPVSLGHSPGTATGPRAHITAALSSCPGHVPLPIFDHYVTSPPLSRAQVPGPDSDGPDFQLLAPHVTSPPYSRLAQRLTLTRVARIPDSARFDHTVKLLPLGGPSA